MAHTLKRDRKERTKKSVRRKRTITSAASENTAQVIKAKIAVGKISASGHAEVGLTQRYQEYIYTKLSEDEEEHRKQKSELAQLKNAIRQKYSDLKRLTNALPSGRHALTFTIQNHTIKAPSEERSPLDPLANHLTIRISSISSSAVRKEKRRSPWTLQRLPPLSQA